MSKRIVFSGLVDGGKSTLIGSLLIQMGVFTEEQYRQAERDAIANGMESWKWAYLLDETEYFYAQKARKLTSSKKLADFPEELDKDTNNDTRPSPEAAKDSEKEMGYCIRTAARIPFNVLKPFSADAYKSWAEYGNKDYPEKYCHKTGRRSNGKTSMKHPVLEG